MRGTCSGYGRYGACRCGPVAQQPWFAALDKAWFENTQVEARPELVERERHPAGMPDATGEVGTGNPRSADLQEGRAHTDHIAGADLFFSDIGQRNVFADHAWLEMQTETRIPERVMIEQVSADRSVETAVVRLRDCISNKAA
jgi:hypothetical protein